MPAYVTPTCLLPTAYSGLQPTDHLSSVKKEHHPGIRDHPALNLTLTPILDHRITVESLHLGTWWEHILKGRGRSQASHLCHVAPQLFDLPTGKGDQAKVTGVTDRLDWSEYQVESQFSACVCVCVLKNAGVISHDMSHESLSFLNIHHYNA